MVCRGKENDAPWGRLKDRVIPLWKDFGAKSYAKVELRKGESVDTLIAKLPYNAQIMPGIELSARPGAESAFFPIIITVVASLMSELNTSRKMAHRNMNPRDGLMVSVSYILSLRRSKSTRLRFRETGYDTEMSGKFECDDDFFNRLWNKAARTLYITMRDTYIGSVPIVNVPSGGAMR